MDVAQNQSQFAGGKLANLKKIPVENLIIGMYVAGLDRPWLDTPFRTQGFYLRSQEAVQRVCETCQYVFVDPRRYDSSLVDQRQRIGRTQGKAEKGAPKLVGKNRIKPAKPHIYTDSASFDEEVSVASPTLDIAMAEVERCLSHVESDGLLDGENFQKAIRPVVQSVIRNQDAIAALIRVRHFDQYLYSHSISCAIWATLLGRELGFPPDQLEELGIACALMDLGKTRLSKSLLTKQGALTDLEIGELQEHVVIGLELLKSSPFGSIVQTQNVIKTHHERHNGSGYPNNLSANSIPLFGRIAGIVDTYDAMISERAYAPATPSYQVLLDLEKNADVLFQKPLVDYFIQAIGIFPVGCVVELNTGEVGIVTQQSNEQRLRPKVMLILDENKLPCSETKVINLAVGTESQVTSWIVRELPRGAHNIDVQKYFMV